MAHGYCEGDEPSGVQSHVHTGGNERDDQPAKHSSRSAQHHNGSHQFEVKGTEGYQARNDQSKQAKSVQTAEDDTDKLPRAAAQGVAQKQEFEFQEVRNHDSPSAVFLPPTSSTNRSSRLASPRTASTVPAANTVPAAITATWSHMR